MDAQIYYSYHPETGEFLSQGEADPNPLEPGEWLLPAHATFKKPPKAKKGHALCFKNAKWQQVPDYRGQTVWLSHSEGVTIKQLGELPPKGAQKDRPHAPPLSALEVKAKRAAAYAHPLTGSDRLYAKANRLQLQNAPAKDVAAAINAAHARFEQIRKEHPLTNEQ